MKQLERSSRMLAQVLRLRAWELEQQRAVFGTATAALNEREQRQRAMERDILASDDRTRALLAAGSALDTVRLQHALQHGGGQQRQLESATADTRVASEEQEAARAALSSLFAEREALDRQRVDVLDELARHRAGQAQREQDEGYAARLLPAQERP